MGYRVALTVLVLCPAVNFMKTASKPVQLIDGFLPFAKVEWTLFHVDILTRAVIDCNRGRMISQRNACVISDYPGILGDWIVLFDRSDECGIEVYEMYAAGRVN
jgi:hypothetical protein